MAKAITIYTRTTCAYCAHVKKFLDLKDQSYDVVNLDDDAEATDLVINKYGARSVPVIVVKDDETNDEKVTIGWNPASLAASIA